MLYECRNENTLYEQIRKDFSELYRQRNGIILREAEEMTFPVCKPCRDYKKAGCVEKIHLGVLTAKELLMTEI